MSADTIPKRAPNRGHATTPDGDPYVVGKGNKYWVRTARGWSPPVPRDEIAMELRKHWPQSKRGGVKLTKPVKDKQGNDIEIPRKPAEIVEDFGTHAEEVVWTYLDAKYDYDTETIYLPVARRRIVTPARSEEVEEYLRIVGGELADRLLDWLATAWDLSRPTSALILKGPKFVGKTTLLQAIAAPWNYTWVELALVLGDFQDGAARSAVWAADEGLSSNMRGDSIKVRRILTSKAQMINLKGQPHGILDGSPRVVANGNGLDILKLGTELFGDDDADAIGSRLFVLDVPQRAAEFLFNHRDIDARAIAGHIAWLHENRKVTPGGRLIVEGNGAAYVQRTVSATPIARKVAAAILDGISEPAAGFGGVLAIPIAGETQLAGGVGEILPAGEDWLAVDFRAVYRAMGTGLTDPGAVGKVVKGINKGRRYQLPGRERRYAVRRGALEAIVYGDG